MKANQKQASTQSSQKERLELHHGEFHTMKSTIVPFPPNSPHDANRSSIKNQLVTMTSKRILSTTHTHTHTYL